VIYLDSNILVSLFIEDANTGHARSWYLSQSGPFAISRWTVIEFLAVVGLLKRKAELKPASARMTIAAFEAEVDKSLVMLPMDDSTVDLVASWLRNPDCSLQTADALHLAIAVKAGAHRIATFDERFAKTARKLRLAHLDVQFLPATSPPRSHARQKSAIYHVSQRESAEVAPRAGKRKQRPAAT
jgi:predicted nucleic acid-binding protein